MCFCEGSVQMFKTTEQKMTGGLLFKPGRGSDEPGKEKDLGAIVKGFYNHKVISANTIT